MLKKIKRWFTKKRVPRCDYGLAEKNEATERKIRVAVKILDRRQDTRDVLEERRLHGTPSDLKDRWLSYVRENT